MMQMNRAALATCLILIIGCSGLRKAETLYDQGHFTEALAEYREALRKDPKNVKAKIGYMRTAPLAAEEHLKRARAAQKAGREEIERLEVGAAVVLDPSNQVAVDWMSRIEDRAAKQRLKEEQEESIDARRVKGEDKAALPINPRSMEGLDLNFTRKTSLKEIFQQLSKNSGVNIILHTSASAQDMQVSVDLRGLTFQRILDTLMLQSDLFYKVIDPNTLMVFKKTPQNLTEYENKLIKTFYLSNAEVENVRQTFNSLMPQLKVFTDKRLNALTIMAKPSDLAIAKRIVNQLDKAKAEVMVYLELLEVTQTSAETVGLLPVVTPTDTTGTYRMGATLNGGGSGLNTNTGALRISKSNVQFMFPSLALDMLKTNGDSKLLASPNVRVVSGEAGEVNIGDKISTTQSSLGTGVSTASTSSSTTSAITSALGGTALSQTQYGYEDVGVKIKVKPRVHYNGDITLELESEIKTEIPGSVAGRPNLSQRIIKTQARLRDGETAVFGGLLKEEEQKSLQGIWGITDIPILGTLLGNHNNSDTKKDVILTIRAVIVRQADLREEDFEAFDPDQSKDLKPFETPEPTPGGPASHGGPAGPAGASGKGHGPRSAGNPPPGPGTRPGPALPGAPGPAALPAADGASGQPAAAAPAAPAAPAASAASASPAGAPSAADAQPAAGPTTPAAGTAAATPGAAGATASLPAGTGASATPAPSGTTAPTPAAAGTPAPAGATGSSPAATGAPATPGAAVAADAAAPSDLVFFMSPMAGTAGKGRSVQITIYASGAEGVTAGTMQLLLDSKVKLNAVNPGDFITAESGTLTRAPGDKGLILINFTRKGGATDSGVFATLDLETVETGKSAILIQGGQYMIGKNPITARVVNAMITVEDSK